MATAKQIAANRRNAKKSTGPRTPEGKAVSRLNALRYGFRAESSVHLSFAGDPRYHRLLADFLNDLRPRDPVQLALAVEMAQASIRLRLLFDIERQSREQIDAMPLCRYLSTLSRYRATAERAYYRALQEFERLKNESSHDRTRSETPLHPESGCASGSASENLHDRTEFPACHPARPPLRTESETAILHDRTQNEANLIPNSGQTIVGQIDTIERLSS